ncbi:MAG TPA: SIS domain-containing protein [Steroidobacteraceae bacterium]|jgi:tagatose-6-phosphate ketose/aldose isomerase|nr:SIS domain-containing protein [Steroidobacteraceae bacterium]
MNAFGLNAVQIERAGAHWTVREILQQPRIWAEIQTAIAGQAVRLCSFLDPLLKLQELRIVLTGAGTSAHIGECLAPALAKTLARRVDAIPTTDLVASPQSYLSQNTPTLLVSFGRSGSSPESVAALEVANSCLRHCSHLIFTCDAEGALYQRASGAPDTYVILLPEASNDRGFAMTSSFTGMLLAAALALRAVPAEDARMSALSSLAGQLLVHSMPLLRSLMSQKFTRVVYLGSKEFKGLAREAALKMLELTDGKVVAVADSPLGFRHGPKTILNGDTLVVVFACNDDYTRKFDLDLIDELRRDAVAGRVVALSVRPDSPQHADNLLLGTARESKDVPDLELCLPYVLFAQTLALLRSLSLGIRPDNPNAAGTVSRVVKGVFIHPWRGRA